MDVIENAHHDIAYEHRIISHGQRALRGEIMGRYLDHSQVDVAAAQQLAKDAGLVVEDDEHYETISRPKRADTTTPYILAIGDIVTDAFNKLRDDQAEVTVDEEGNKRLSMEFGSKPPYESVEIVEAGGN